MRDAADDDGSAIKGAMWAIFILVVLVGIAILIISL